MVASLPNTTITGTTGADVRTTSPGAEALVETYAGGDTITLTNAGDWGNAGDGNDTIYLGSTGSVTLDQSVVAGAGGDSILVHTAAGANAVTMAANLNGNAGDDTIFITAGGTLNGTFITGGADNDTIRLTGVSNAISSTIQGGSGKDTLEIGSSAISNANINGNKGADSITLLSTSNTLSFLGAGAGHDTVVLGASSRITSVAGGSGRDSIRVVSAAEASSIAGGGLNDTISFASALGGGVVYGDAFNTVDGGNGTGSKADGNDLIGSTSTDINTGIASGTSVFGGGGSDTIQFQTAESAANLYGGNGGDSIFIGGGDTGVSLFGGAGADTISLLNADGVGYLDGGVGNDTMQVSAASAVSVFGGAGTDTIEFTNGSAASVLGGAGGDYIYVGESSALAAFAGGGNSGSDRISGDADNDTIALLNFASASSVSGGAGDDSIYLGTAATVGSFATNGTINGGEGTDTIVIDSTGGVSFTAVAQRYDQGGANMTAGVVSVAYGAGDIIRLDASGFTAGNVIGGILEVGDTAGFLTGGGATGLSATTAGTLSVYSDGTDTYFAMTNGALGSGIAFRVTGADLVNTGASENALNAVNTTNFGFTLSASAGTSISITLI